MKTVRTNVMLPIDLLTEIDRVTGSRRRSAFLADAAREKLALVRFERAVSRAFGSWKDARHADLMTEADMIRYLAKARASTNRRSRRLLDRAQSAP